MRNFSYTREMKILIGLILGLLLFTFILWPLIPVEDPPEYYLFADQRRLWGIPNAFDVLSNLAFLFAGAYGLLPRRAGPHAEKPRAESPSKPGSSLSTHHFFISLLATSSLLVFFGSAYFHWNPVFERLFWDRLALTLVFSTLISLFIVDRVHPLWGLRSSFLLIPLALFSAIGWRFHILTLRPYIVLQFGGFLLLIGLLFLCPRGLISNRSTWMGLASYAVAKFFEIQDVTIFAVSGLISGHTLKHFFAGLALFLIFYAYKAGLQRWAPGFPDQPPSK